MPSSDAEMLKNIHSARGEFYSFLSRMFSNVPDSEMLTMLSDMSAKINALADITDNQDLKTGAKGIADFLDKRNSLSGKELSDFDLERSRHYTFMFCLAKSIPTDESIYTSVEHVERQEPYDDMIRLFKQYGMQKTQRISENEDFVSYEFLFMSKLAYDCADFTEAYDSEKYTAYLQAQYDFHVNHFDKWIYQFFARVVQSEVEDELLYKHLACFGAGFINEDKLTLNELLSQEPHTV